MELEKAEKELIVINRQTWILSIIVIILLVAGMLKYCEYRELEKELQELVKVENISWQKKKNGVYSILDS